MNDIHYSWKRRSTAAFENVNNTLNVCLFFQRIKFQQNSNTVIKPVTHWTITSVNKNWPTILLPDILPPTRKLTNFWRHILTNFCRLIISTLALEQLEHCIIPSIGRKSAEINRICFRAGSVSPLLKSVSIIGYFYSYFKVCSAEVHHYHCIHKQCKLNMITII